NACLVLLLVAVSVHWSYGRLYGSTCSSTSDCTYDHASCSKYDQCDQGKCRCKRGYERKYYSGGCTKESPKKKAGESCSTASCEGDLRCTSCPDSSKLQCMSGKSPTTSENCYV
ncbi:hypothetical protein LSAT2_019608, partial [Lamellibrachia satsuma]